MNGGSLQDEKTNININKEKQQQPMMENLLKGLFLVAPHSYSTAPMIMNSLKTPSLSIYPISRVALITL